MAILRTFPLLHTLNRPHLDATAHQQPHQAEEAAERGHAAIEGNLGDYPSELLQLRLQAIQDHLSKHHPSTAIYIASLGAVLLITITLIATCLALHVSDGKPWVLGVIVIMILLFISKMAFLSRIEKEHKGIASLLLTFNEQDMPHYGVLYRLRPRAYSPPSTETTVTGTRRTRSDWLIRLAYKLNLGLPCWALDLTTIDHIDEFSFQDHPATDPHASPEEILARENELPTYRPKAEEGDSENGIEHHLSQQHRVLGEALPPQYADIVEMQAVVTEDPSSSSSSSSSSPPSTGFSHFVQAPATATTAGSSSQRI
ncbi:hypothetical protein EC957_003340 [Mortierella hygrophila]|uniref:Uncharacterized protein n=1 Tax=Mortierella hygrophila TaxID=979708 RepID=A0A9P6F2Z5_9FUNG|nr:hypothetical protein EC957_003340 [Mortierella hygrophila]